MDEDEKRARREALWNSVVLVNAQSAGIDISQPRTEVAANLLEFQRAEYSAAVARIIPDDIGSDHDAFMARAAARLTWQLLMHENYGWLVDPYPGEADYWADDHQSSARRNFGAHLASGGPLHGDGLDPVAIVMPRWLATAISEGFDALPRGETQPIFRATPGGQHGRAFTWDKMRLRAVQHVAFLTGAGSTKKSARDRVALATKIKADTLRDWETDLNKNPLEKFEIGWAKQAGELSVVLEHNPDYAKSDGNSVDGHAYAVLLELQREPLGAFGLRYREHRFDIRQR